MNISSLRLALYCCCIFTGLHTVAQNEIKAGDIAPNAKVLDVDEFGNFQEGFCIVRKGNQTALIDTAGNFILPFNSPFYPSPENHSGMKVSYINKLWTGFSEGMCTVRDAKTGKMGYINRQMKLVIPCLYEQAAQFHNGYAEVMGNGGSLFINKSGAKANITTNNFGDVPLVPGFIKNTKNQYGYFDLAGKLVIAGPFDKAMPFSDGMAAVMKLDNFGKEKWGFINANGKQVIDFMYSLQPSNYYAGYAIVRPLEKTDFVYAYINKTGAIKMKIAQDQCQAESGFFGYYSGNGKPITDFDYKNLFEGRCFVEGLAPFAVNVYGNNVQLMDTAGNKYFYPVIKGSYTSRSTHQTYSGAGNEKSYGNFRITPPFVNGMALLWMTGPSLGVIDRNNNVLIPPVFERLAFSYSNPALIKAAFPLYNEAREIRDGFINRQGLFVIVKGPGPKW